MDVVTPVRKLGTRYLVRKHGSINKGTGPPFFFCDRFAQLSNSSNPTQYNWHNAKSGGESALIGGAFAR